MPPVDLPSTALASELALQLGGPPQIRIGTSTRPLDPKDALLFAWLALEGPTARAQLAGLLFPEVDETKARNNLRQRLFQLKKKLGADVVAGDAVLQLAPSVSVDVLADAALGLELLCGVVPDDLETLNEWLSEQRAQRRARHGQWLTEAAEKAEAASDLATALTHASALLNAQPENEKAHRRVMRLHYLQGHRATALEAYEECKQVLKTRLGSAPSKETEALRAQIESSALTSASIAPVPDRVPLNVLRPPRLIGREQPWRVLSEIWTQAQTAVVVGEAGLGKSRLLSDLVQAHGRALHLSARPGDESVPYAVLTKFVRKLVPEMPPPASMARELARLLPELGEAEPIRNAEEQARFVNAVDTYVAQASQIFSAVVLDDLHFADSASSEILLRAAQTTRRAWFIAMRSTELAPTTTERIRALLEEHAAQYVELRPLTQEQVFELVTSLEIADTEALAQNLAHALYRRAGGNPLYTLETIKAIFAAGLDLATLERCSAPASGGVGAIIGRRLERLSRDALKLARCAAIAGQNFSVALAARVLEVNALDLIDACNELEASQVFREGAFAHDLIFEAALTSVPAPIARELHRQIAGFLSTEAAPAIVAEHWRAAGQWAQAGAAFMQAAQAAHRASRRAEEAAFLEHATECFVRQGDKSLEFEALAQWASALTWVDIGQRHHLILDRMLAAAQTPQQRLQALTEIGYSQANRGNRLRSIEVAHEALTLAESLQEREWAYKNAGTLTIGYVSQGRHEEALEVIESQRAWVESSGSARHRRDFEGDRAWPLLALNRLEEAREGLTRAIALGRELGDLAELNTLLSLQVGAYARGGAVERALEVSAQAIALHEVLGSVAGVPLFDRAVMAWLWMPLGRYEAALAEYDKVIAAFETSGMTMLMWRTRALRAVAYVQLGQISRAQQSLMQGRNDTELAPLDHLVLGLIERAAGRGHSAAALAHFRAADPSPKLGGTMFSLAEVARLYQIEAMETAAAHGAAAELASLALTRGQNGIAIAALAQFAKTAAAQAQHGAAIEAAHRALDLMQTFHPEVMYRAEVWATLAAALRSAGQEQVAAELEIKAAAWIEETARTQVPATFRESFLERNPSNRLLRQAAARAQKRMAPQS